MKKIIFSASMALLLSITLFAATKDQMAVDFVKTLIKMSNKPETGRIDSLRYFQYASTTAKNNPSSYVLSSYGKMAVKESGLKTPDKGRYITALADRSGARIKRLWDANKEELFNLFPPEKYNEILKYDVDSLIQFHDSAEYNELMKKLKTKSPKPDQTTMDAAGELTGWSKARELSFWYRRTGEKNDSVVYEILKALQARYSE